MGFTAVIPFAVRGESFIRGPSITEHNGPSRPESGPTLKDSNPQANLDHKVRALKCDQPLAKDFITKDFPLLYLGHPINNGFSSMFGNSRGTKEDAYLPIDYQYATGKNDLAAINRIGARDYHATFQGRYLQLLVRALECPGDGENLSPLAKSVLELNQIVPSLLSKLFQPDGKEIPSPPGRKASSHLLQMQKKMESLMSVSSSLFTNPKVDPSFRKALILQLNEYQRSQMAKDDPKPIKEFEDEIKKNRKSLDENESVNTELVQALFHANDSLDLMIGTRLGSYYRMVFAQRGGTVSSAGIKKPIDILSDTKGFPPERTKIAGYLSQHLKNSTPRDSNHWMGGPHYWTNNPEAWNYQNLIQEQLRNMSSKEKAEALDWVHRKQKEFSVEPLNLDTATSMDGLSRLGHLLDESVQKDYLISERVEYGDYLMNAQQQLSNARVPATQSKFKALDAILARSLELGIPLTSNQSQQILGLSAAHQELIRAILLKSSAVSETDIAFIKDLLKEPSHQQIIQKSLGNAKFKEAALTQLASAFNEGALKVGEKMIPSKDLIQAAMGSAEELALFLKKYGIQESELRATLFEIIRIKNGPARTRNDLEASFIHAIQEENPESNKTLVDDFMNALKINLGNNPKSEPEEILSKVLTEHDLRLPPVKKLPPMQLRGALNGLNKDWRREETEVGAASAILASIDHRGYPKDTVNPLDGGEDPFDPAHVLKSNPQADAFHLSNSTEPESPLARFLPFYGSRGIPSATRNSLLEFSSVATPEQIGKWDALHQAILASKEHSASTTYGKFLLNPTADALDQLYQRIFPNSANVIAQKEQDRLLNDKLIRQDRDPSLLLNWQKALREEQNQFAQNNLQGPEGAPLTKEELAARRLDIEANRLQVEGIISNEYGHVYRGIQNLLSDHASTPITEALWPGEPKPDLKARRERAETILRGMDDHKDANIPALIDQLLEANDVEDKFNAHWSDVTAKSRAESPKTDSKSLTQLTLALSKHYQDLAFSSGYQSSEAIKQHQISSLMTPTQAKAADIAAKDSTFLDERTGKGHNDSQDLDMSALQAENEKGKEVGTKIRAEQTLNALNDHNNNFRNESANTVLAVIVDRLNGGNSSIELMDTMIANLKTFSDSGTENSSVVKDTLNRLTHLRQLLQSKEPNQEELVKQWVNLFLATANEPQSERKRKTEIATKALEEYMQLGRGLAKDSITFLDTYFKEEPKDIKNDAQRVARRQQLLSQVIGLASQNQTLPQQIESLGTALAEAASRKIATQGLMDLKKDLLAKLQVASPTEQWTEEKLDVELAKAQKTATEKLATSHQALEEKIKPFKRMGFEWNPLTRTLTYAASTNLSGHDNRWVESQLDNLAADGVRLSFGSEDPEGPRAEYLSPSLALRETVYKKQIELRDNWIGSGNQIEFSPKTAVQITIDPKTQVPTISSYISAEKARNEEAAARKVFHDKYGNLESARMKMGSIGHTMETMSTWDYFFGAGDTETQKEYTKAYAEVMRSLQQLRGYDAIGAGTDYKGAPQSAYQMARSFTDGHIYRHLKEVESDIDKVHRDIWALAAIEFAAGLSGGKALFAGGKEIAKVGLKQLVKSQASKGAVWSATKGFASRNHALLFGGALSGIGLGAAQWDHNKQVNSALERAREMAELRKKSGGYLSLEDQTSFQAYYQYLDCDGNGVLDADQEPKPRCYGQRGLLEFNQIASSVAEGAFNFWAIGKFQNLVMGNAGVLGFKIPQRFAAGHMSGMAGGFAGATGATGLLNKWIYQGTNYMAGGSEGEGARNRGIGRNSAYSEIANDTFVSFVGGAALGVVGKITGPALYRTSKEPMKWLSKIDKVPGLSRSADAAAHYFAMEYGHKLGEELSHSLGMDSYAKLAELSRNATKSEADKQKEKATSMVQSVFGKITTAYFSRSMSGATRAQRYAKLFRNGTITPAEVRTWFPTTWEPSLLNLKSLIPSNKVAGPIKAGMNERRAHKEFNTKGYQANQGAYQYLKRRDLTDTLPEEVLSDVSTMFNLHPQELVDLEAISQQHGLAPESLNQINHGIGTPDSIPGAVPEWAKWLGKSLGIGKSSKTMNLHTRLGEEIKVPVANPRELGAQSLLHQNDIKRNAAGLIEDFLLRNPSETNDFNTAFKLQFKPDIADHLTTNGLDPAHNEAHRLIIANLADSRSQKWDPNTKTNKTTFNAADAKYDLVNHWQERGKQFKTLGEYFTSLESQPPPARPGGIVVDRVSPIQEKMNRARSLDPIEYSQRLTAIELVKDFLALKDIKFEDLTPEIIENARNTMLSRYQPKMGNGRASTPANSQNPGAIFDPGPITADRVNLAADFLKDISRADHPSRPLYTDPQLQFWGTDPIEFDFPTMFEAMRRGVTAH